ncbi:gamma-aminobutyric acid receptor alpha-like [Babylonia areolata]|uniref:gamma-aminobutyric acid receptor alpha-like n=1 Tax=Babylonia areolata TaxID=304850 RepID=UPI003FD112AF
MMSQMGTYFIVFLFSGLLLAAGLDPEVTQERAANVTGLLNLLMMGYDKRLRPGIGGPPLVVKADVEIRSMGPISEKDMIYSMDCYFRQVWTDSRLSFNRTEQQVSNVSLNVKMLERIWHPDTIFINGGHSYLHTITAPNKFFRLNHDGSILYSQRLTIKASCPMHLEKFPMDTQKCPLHIASFAYSTEDVVYQWRFGEKRAVVASRDMRLSQFDLTGMPAASSTACFKGTTHSVLTVYFDFRRHTGYFLIQVYVPCCLLVALSWVSFWINREATSDRITLGSTTMLTMTYLALDSRDNLPRVTYSTALDIYVLMCFFFVFATIVQFAAVHHFTKYGTAEPLERPAGQDTDTDEEDSLESEELGLAAAALDNGVGRFGTVRAKKFEPTCPRSLSAALSCLLATRRARLNKRVRNALGLNSVSKIDRAARVMFPASFIVLNILYWIAYIA